MKPLTARKIADRLGRGVVRACYPAARDDDDGGDTAAVIVTRFVGPTGEPLQMFFHPTGPTGPRLTDLGSTFDAVRDGDRRLTHAEVRACLTGTGVHYDERLFGEVWTEIDERHPEEDAAELLGVMLRLTGVGFARPPPATARRQPRNPKPRTQGNPR